jgi:DNA gyrase subunit B
MSKYTAKDIGVLEGLEPVRKKPGMYLGSTDAYGVYQACKEIIDNAIDEAINSDTWYVGIDFDGDRVQVWDQGRGIPVEKHHKIKGKSTLEIIFTMLHAGGKLGKGEAYKKGSRGCFVGDTKIKLLDGTSVTIQNLYKKWVKKQKAFWLYSFDIEGDTAFVPRKCVQVHETFKTKHLVDVELDNGEIIRCTPDHPFLMFSGKYVEAKKLKAGQRLRALHTSYDKDGYEIHCSRNHRTSTKVGNNDFRTARTVMECLGHSISDLHVHHKNGNKVDNRPDNLEVLDRKSHFWEDYHENNKHSKFVNKDKRLRKISSRNAKLLNKNPKNAQNAQAGKIIQCAARALNDYGKLSFKTYDKSRGWCYPSSQVAELYFDWDQLERKARRFLKANKDRDRAKNGGFALNYKLASEYSRSPVDNIANHFVVAVTKVTLEEPVAVYDLTVEGEHNYLLDAGVFVHNTHGVGASVTNAVSAKFKVTTFRDKKWWSQTYKQGIPATKVAECSRPSVEGFKKGTLVEFTLDKEIFKKITPNLGKIKEMCSLASYLHAGLTIEIFEKGKRLRKYYQPKGVRKLLKKMIAEDEGVQSIGKPFEVHGDGVDLALQWSDHDADKLKSYVCGSYTSEGGTHLEALYRAIGDAIAPYRGRKNFKAEDLRVGLQGVLNVTIQAPAFTSQTKQRLATPEAKELVYDTVYKPLVAYFKSNKSMMKQLVDRAVAIREVNNQAKLDRKAASKLMTKKAGKSMLPAKLATAPHCKPHERELYIVEGDSAAGTAERARNSKYQEVLPLTGKLLNVYKDVKGSKVFENSRVMELFLSIGYNPKFADPLENLRVGNKIVFMSDPDPDGEHITVLLLSLIQKYLPGLFAKGMIYIIEPSLYLGSYKGKRYFAPSLAELKKLLPKNIPDSAITRLKGWGEANAEDIRPLAFDEKTRRLIQIKPMDAKDLKKFISTVGEGSEARRELLGL